MMAAFKLSLVLSTFAATVSGDGVSPAACPAGDTDCTPAETDQPDDTRLLQVRSTAPIMEPADSQEMLLTLNLPLQDNDMKMMMLETQGWRSGDGLQRIGAQKTKSFVIQVKKDMEPAHADGENGVTADCIDAVVVSNSSTKDLIICETPGQPLAKAGQYICSGDVTSLKDDDHALDFSDCQVLPPPGKKIVQVQIGSVDNSDLAISQLLNISTLLGPDYVIGVPAEYLGQMGRTPENNDALLKLAMKVGGTVLKAVSTLFGVACSVYDATEWMTQAYQSYLKTVASWGCDWKLSWACAANQAYFRLKELQQETFIFHKATCVLAPLTGIAGKMIYEAGKLELISGAAGKQEGTLAQSNSTVGPSPTDDFENTWSSSLQVSVAKLPLSSEQMAIMRGMRMGSMLQKKSIEDQKQQQFITSSPHFIVQVNQTIAPPLGSDRLLESKCIDAIIRSPDNAPHKNIELCGMPNVSEVRAGLHVCVGNVNSIRGDGHSIGYVNCQPMPEGTRKQHLVQVHISSAAEFDLAIQQIEELAVTVGPDYVLSVPQRFMSLIQQRRDGRAAIQTYSTLSSVLNVATSITSIGCKVHDAVVQLEKAYDLLASGVAKIGCWLGSNTICKIQNAHERLQQGLGKIKVVQALTCGVVLPLAKVVHAKYLLDPSTCEKDTGGTCYWSPCNAERQASCVKSRCVCGSGSCVLDGKCWAAR